MNFSMMPLKEIKSYFSTIKPEDYDEYIQILKKDKRKTVMKYADSLEKKLEKYHMEHSRIMELYRFEKELYDLGFEMIAGLDEAGRGPLAGPVVAASVILPKGYFLEGIDDSKKLSAKKRESLYKIIHDIAIDIGVGIVDNKTIDRINILNATKLAMKKAIESMENQPEFLLIDAVKLTDINIKQKSIIKGDSTSISIAAASIIAKVTRDNIVKEYDKKYKGYGFAKHKGYGTKEHYAAIKKYGITPVHRKSFLKSIG